MNNEYFPRDKSDYENSFLSYISSYELNASFPINREKAKSTPYLKRLDAIFFIFYIDDV